MENITVVIATPLLTFLFNYIFYRFIRTDIEQKIHQNNISYSGVFKEKIEIYRELLERTYDIKKELAPLIIIGDRQEHKKMKVLIDDYIRFFSINRPFLSKAMIKELDLLKKEFNFILESFKRHVESKNSEITKPNWLEAGKKLSGNNPFKEIEKRIIKEIKQDLRTI